MDLNGQSGNDYFGGAVSLSSDGSIVAIGAHQAYGNDSLSGQVQVFLIDDNNDFDKDGLSDRYEITITATDPYDSDSDDDGLTDGYELHSSMTNPHHIDSDGDGLSDEYEENMSATN